ncbi:hypothetical protein [Anaerovorax odorimutans]|uniref:hypothetical protein n=1 Tax=Anaerovorax odorimutans TaxID=109327 RepID=UPI0004200C1E|nr:hypothetical protein [Anaerovorax odorimutans]
MLMEEKILYIDMEQLYRRFSGAPSLGVINGAGEEQKLVFTGKYILSMPVSDRQEKVYRVLAEEYDVRFIFDDEIPKLEFYPMPQIGVFAIDSLGGCFGSTNIEVDISVKDAPIYYVNNELQCYYLAPNMFTFIQLIVFQPNWKKELVKNGLLGINPSSAGNDYLVNVLNSDRNNKMSLDTTKKIKNTITIYNSFEEAKKVVEFYNIHDLLGKLESLE